ncbi:MAG: GGDEF domain-containing protein [Burkholderiales bacterium]|nr:GGDEF domain-containing protein [Burkholderiales bacterium]MDE2566445.1 GGDEF domain-containing protein [Burkholderiales bacterium]
MSRVVEHLAELTGCRDRDLVDVTLVGALKDLLRPHAVAVYRCVGEPGAQRWLTRARLGPGDITPAADPAWTPLEQLPELGSRPERLACWKQQRALTVAGMPALAYFPLVGEREPLGVLELATRQPLARPEMRLVESILRIYRNFAGLLDAGERDPLTGLLNRKTFDENFLRTVLREPPPGQATTVPEARRAPGLGEPWLGLIDIDHFKRVNDRCGHLIGDEVLLLMARLMRSSFRLQDHLYRFGGEEFVVLMHCGSGEDAAAAFERLRANVAGYAFPQVGRITVSVGFTALRVGDAPSQAFERADRAVYYAKQNGRNQVQHHAALVAAGRLAEAARGSDVELF